MRTISTAGLAMLRTPLGTSPICIVEIDWTDGTTSTYADSTVGTIPGKIVEMSALDDATSLAGNSSSSQLSVTLDDTDGSIKAIFDTHDPHKRPARVYQYFTGLGLSDRFLLFSGVLMSPISWSERSGRSRLRSSRNWRTRSADLRRMSRSPVPSPIPFLTRRGR